MYKSNKKYFNQNCRQLTVSLFSLLLMVGIIPAEAKPVLTNNLLQTTALLKDSAIAPSGKLPAADGVYLYGQSPQPEQIGQEYMVFEVHQGKVVGAFYLPQSEFSCFSGSIESGKLALTVANTPDSEPYPDLAAEQNSQQIATLNSTDVGNGYNAIAYPYSVALQNYHQINSVSANDQRLLQMCKNNP